MDKLEWQIMQEKALDLVSQGLMTPIKYKQHFEKEDAPSEEELNVCKKLIDFAENDQTPNPILTQYVTDESYDPLPGLFDSD